jgi:hypothetical protein
MTERSSSASCFFQKLVDGNDGIHVVVMVKRSIFLLDCFVADAPCNDGIWNKVLLSLFCHSRAGGNPSFRIIANSKSCNIRCISCFLPSSFKHLFGFPLALTVCAYFISLSFGCGNDRMDANIRFFGDLPYGNDGIG